MAVGDGFFYYPTRSVYGRPETYGLSYESVFFAGADGAKLHGWFFPSSEQARGTVIHCHGNGGNITGHFEHVKWLPGCGWNVFCFDYRGYGMSSGRVTRAGTIEDGKAAVAYVQARGDVDPERIVLLGQSLGGAVGIVVTAQCPSVRGIAVEGAFSRYRAEAVFAARQNILTRGFAGLLSKMLISDGFEPIDSVGRIAPRPALFVCGTADRVVDYRQTVALYEAAGEPKSLHIIDGGGHTDAMLDAQGQNRFAEFFERCVDGSAH